MRAMAERVWKVSELIRQINVELFRYNDISDERGPIRGRTYLFFDQGFARPDARGALRHEFSLPPLPHRKRVAARRPRAPDTVRAEGGVPAQRRRRRASRTRRVSTGVRATEKAARG